MDIRVNTFNEPVAIIILLRVNHGEVEKYKNKEEVNQFRSGKTFVYPNHSLLVIYFKTMGVWNRRTQKWQLHYTQTVKTQTHTHVVSSEKNLEKKIGIVFYRELSFLIA